MGVCAYKYMYMILVYVYIYIYSYMFSGLKGFKNKSKLNLF